MAYNPKDFPKLVMFIVLLAIFSSAAAINTSVIIALNNDALQQDGLLPLLAVKKLRAPRLYRDSTYGFSFRYPGVYGWIAGEDGASYVFFGSSGGMARAALAIYPNPDAKPLESFFRAPTGGARAADAVLERRMLGGQPGIVRTFPTTKIREAYAAGDGFVLSLVQGPEQEEKDFALMLDTLVFIPAAPATR